MAKTNIRTTALDPMDAFTGMPVGDVLKRIYKHAEEYSFAVREWYWRSIKVKRRSSLWSRSFAFVLFLAGSVLQLAATLGDQPKERLQMTEIGLAALITAGLFLAADRVFGWSSGWLRYVTTVTALENLKRNFDLEWSSRCIEKNGEMQEADKAPLYELAKSFEQAVEKLQEDETSKWAADYNAGLALLGELIQHQREATEKNLEAARTLQEKAVGAAATGAIELRLQFKGAPVPLKIALDDEPAVDFMGYAWTRLGVEPGLHKARIVIPSTPPLTNEIPVVVPAGGIGGISFTGE